MEDEWMGAQPDMPAEALRYKHYRTIRETAIYVSECGGVLSRSHNMGLRVPKFRTDICPAMKAKSLKHRYPYICFGRGGYKILMMYVHRAVAEVYLRPKNLFEVEVDHLDGNIMNFHVLNLEWVTHEENIRRRWEKYYQKKLNSLKV